MNLGTCFPTCFHDFTGLTRFDIIAQKPNYRSYFFRHYSVSVFGYFFLIILDCEMKYTQLNFSVNIDQVLLFLDSSEHRILYTDITSVQEV